MKKETVYITQWWQKVGIVETRMESFASGGIWAYDPVDSRSMIFVARGHWHRTYKEAQKRIQTKAARMIANHEKKIEALRKWMPEEKGGKPMVEFEMNGADVASFQISQIRDKVASIDDAINSTINKITSKEAAGDESV